MKPSEQIRIIWQEIKEKKRLFEMGVVKSNEQDNRFCELNDKFEEIETLFGHESSLSKAIIYYLDSKS